MSLKISNANEGRVLRWGRRMVCVIRHPRKALALAAAAIVRFAESPRVAGYLAVGAVGMGVLTWLFKPHLPHVLFVALAVIAIALVAVAIAGLIAHVVGIEPRAAAPVVVGPLHPDVQRDEIEFARRMVSVARKTQAQLAMCKDRFNTAYRVGDANGVVDGNWRDKCYEREFSSFQHFVGTDWNALVRELDARHLLILRRAVYESTVNWTGLDERIAEIEALGLGLLKDHGLNA
jgi:hypothetical protein